MKRFIYILLLALCVVAAYAATGDDAEQARLRAKAQRFYDNGEWLNAQATYLLVLDRDPRDVDAYARAIVVASELSDTTGITGMLHRSALHNVSTDSLLNAVQRVSIATGHPSLYRDILLLTQEQFPWMARNIDRQLLNYYLFRDNGPEIVRYSTALLQGLPEDTGFSLALARGYMLCNNVPEAENVWRNILNAHPDNIDALLALGNCLMQTGRRNEALPYLIRANEIHPTPYLQRVIDGR